MLHKFFIKTFITILFILAVMMIYQCGLGVIAMGNQQEIFVVADSSFWNDIAPAINEVFEAPIYTPISEPTYIVSWIPLEKLNKYKDRMNVFLIGTAESETPASEYLKEILPAEFKSGVENGSMFYIFNNDLYASGQIGLIMYANNRQEFKSRFEQYKDEIFNKFSDKYYARMSKIMFDKGEQTDLEEFISEKYGWKIRIQHDYFIATQDINNQYLWLRRTDPDRWISIWESTGDTSDLSYNSLVAVRDSVLGKYYNGDKVYTDDTYLKNTEFSGRPAGKLVGIWVNDSLRVGGPFRLYAFKDAVKSRIYYVDIAVMAPNKQKKPYLDQLEVIAHTFDVVETKK